MNNNGNHKVMQIEPAIEVFRQSSNDQPVNGDMAELSEPLQKIGESILALQPDMEVADVPPLLRYAQLTEEQQKEASTAGVWLDEYVAFAKEASPLTPASFHVASALFAGSLSIARRLCLPVSVSTNTIYPNLYMLFIGHSTRPRKTTALRVLRGLINEAGLGHFLLADRQTPEAFTLDMTTRVTDSYETLSKTEKEIWLKERAIAAQRGWLLEEASHLLDSFNRDYTSGLLPLVLSMYDASDIGMQRNTISRGRESVEKAYLTIFGATTYGAMAAHINQPPHWNNGLWARFALIGDDNSGAWKFWPTPLDYPEKLTEKLRFIAYELLPMPEAKIGESESGEEKKKQRIKEVLVNPALAASEVSMTRDAWKQWENYSKAISYDMLLETFGSVPNKFYASYGRLGTMLVKVAIILATLDADRLPVTVDGPHVYRAQMIVEEWRSNLHSIFSKMGNSRKKDLTEIIASALAKKGKEWVPRRDLLRGLNKKWSETEGAIDDLVASGDIERRSIKNQPGPKSEEYRLVVP